MTGSQWIVSLRLRRFLVAGTAVMAQLFGISTLINCPNLIYDCLLLFRRKFRGGFLRTSEISGEQGAIRSPRLTLTSSHFGVGCVERARSACFQRARPSEKELRNGQATNWASIQITFLAMGANTTSMAWSRRHALDLQPETRALCARFYASRANRTLAITLHVTSALTTGQPAPPATGGSEHGGRRCVTEIVALALWCADPFTCLSISRFSHALDADRHMEGTLPRLGIRWLVQRTILLGLDGVPALALCRGHCTTALCFPSIAALARLADVRSGRRRGLSSRRLPKDTNQFRAAWQREPKRGHPSHRSAITSASLHAHCVPRPSHPLCKPRLFVLATRRSLSPPTPPPPPSPLAVLSPPHSPSPSHLLTVTPASTPLPEPIPPTHSHSGWGLGCLRPCPCTCWQRITNPEVVCFHYVRTWMLPDLIAGMPLAWPNVPVQVRAKRPCTPTTISYGQALTQPVISSVLV